MAEERFILTPSGYERMQEEIRALEAMRAEQRDRLGDVENDRDNMDGNEAGAFFEVKTALEHADERLGHLRYVLERAEIRTDDPDPRRVNTGERVTVWDVDDRRELTFDLLSGPEAQLTYSREDGGRDVTVDSPVGQALLGGRVGDIVEVEIPDGVVRYAIRRIGEIPSSRT